MWVGSEAGGLLLYQPTKRETNIFILYLSNTAGAQPNLGDGIETESSKGAYCVGPCDRVVQRAYCLSVSKSLRYRYRYPLDLLKDFLQIRLVLGDELQT